MSASDEVARNSTEAAVSALHGVPDGATSRRTRPPPYDEVHRQLTASATVDGLIRVVGRPGSGKRYQASKWLRERTGKDPKVFAARDLPANYGGWPDGEAAMRDGRGIIVVGGEKLSSESRERLDDFARLPRPGGGPNAPVILTTVSILTSPNLKCHPVPEILNRCVMAFLVVQLLTGLRAAKCDGG
jgi:sigma-54 dependent transcriptional regulator, acetoin dehydrogenase operon transcriptional activator AcoR